MHAFFYFIQSSRTHINKLAYLPAACNDLPAIRLLEVELAMRQGKLLYGYSVYEQVD